MGSIYTLYFFPIQGLKRKKGPFQGAITPSSLHFKIGKQPVLDPSDPIFSDGMGETSPLSSSPWTINIKLKISEKVIFLENDPIYFKGHNSYTMNDKGLFSFDSSFNLK